MKFRGAFMASVGFVASIFVAWEFAIHIAHLPAVVMPSPTRVCSVLVERAGEIAYHAGVTAGEAMAGYALANVLALTMALCFLWFPVSETIVAPWAVVIKNVPFVSVASILLITLGDTLAPKLLIVVLVCFFPLLSNLSKGLRAADTVLLDRMRVLCATRWQVFRKVLWPAAVPYYLAAHEAAFTASIVGAIVAEWFFSRKGLGYLIVQATVDYRSDLLYAVNLVAGGMALAAYISCKLVARRLLRWQEL